MSEEFELTYEVDDGYCGSRPHELTIYSDDIQVNDTEDDLKETFWNAIQFDFEQSFFPHSKQEAEFITWAKDLISKLKEEEEQG